MGFDLTANRKDGGDYHFGAFSWPVLLEACGYIFPYVNKGARWYHAPEADPLVTDKDQHGYLLLGYNDGFRVSSADAKLMARCARNFAALNDPSRDEDARPEPIREDFIEKIAAFADWAEQSGGFRVW